MEFENWIVTDEGIDWTGSRGSYFIEKARLLELTERGGIKMYDWLVHIPQKTWVDVPNVYALNDAFLFAVKHFGLTLNQDFFDNAIEYQRGMISSKR